jgi:formylglycine-generating enzyme required for sulfatase activity
VYNSDINGVKGEVRTDREWNPCRPRSPDHQPVKGPSLPSGPVFTDLDDGGGYKNHSSYNVGFQHWHPIPVTPFGDSLAGQGGLGGVWEWTSTPLEKQEGFEAMEIYPGYTGMCLVSSSSVFLFLKETKKKRVKRKKKVRHADMFCFIFPLADFFDGKHNIVLGGSWATHPRIAGRTTL